MIKKSILETGGKAMKQDENRRMAEAFIRKIFTTDWTRKKKNLYFNVANE